MKRISQAVIFCTILVLGISWAKAQTNLEYWTENVNISLIGLTNGVAITNGIVAKVGKGTAKISSRDIVQALQNKLVQAVSTGITNFDVVVENHDGHAIFLTTNTVVMAFPIFTPTNVTFSTAAKLLFLQPLGTNDLGPLLVIRDQQPPVDFEVGAYFSIGKVSFDGRDNPLITQGRFDLVHDLTVAVDYGIERVVFDANAFSDVPPLGTYFDVQGFASEQQSSLTKGDQVLSHHLAKAVIAQVAGTGQIGDPNSFAVFHGTISFGGGRHETK